MISSFDTLSAAKALKSAGLTDVSAEAIVTVVQQSSNHDHLATKADLGATRAELGHQLESLESRLKLFVASTVLGGAGVIVLAQIVLKTLGIAS